MSTLASNALVAPRYSIIVPEPTLARASDYLQALRRDRAAQAGTYLGDQLHGVDLDAMTALDLLGRLFDTRQPKIYAETAVIGDGSDWNLGELGLLGDVSVALPVTIFDDGNHQHPTPHDPPFPGVLVFSAGALLRNGRGQIPADWNEVTTANGSISTDGYCGLNRRRLVPVLRYINEHAARPRSAVVTVPGLGCGQFAGPFRGQLGARLREVLQTLLIEYGRELGNIRCVYFDPYGECQNFRREIHGISFMVRPLQVAGNQARSQLCRPACYAENGDDFSACTLYSIVAWDHVSWPGNDFFGGSRATDDGVKAAATNSMMVLTGVAGQYDPARGAYQPPDSYSSWGAVVDDLRRTMNLRLWNERAIWQASAPR